VARRALRSLAAEDPEDLYYMEGESASELLSALVRCASLGIVRHPLSCLHMFKASQSGCLDLPQAAL
jgi:hypothetical protein